MVIKGGKPIFFQTLSIVIIVLIINVAYLIYKSGGLPNGLTGFSIKSNIADSYSGLSIFGRVFFITEMSLVFLILLIALVRDISLNKSRTEVLELHIKRNSEENKTDIDTLYEALKDKKELNISTIAKAFEVDKDTVMEWAKILESAELTVIDYPGFSEPVVKYNEKATKIIDIKNDDVVKDSLNIKKEIRKNEDKIKENIPKEEILKEEVQKEEIPKEEVLKEDNTLKENKVLVEKKDEEMKKKTEDEETKKRIEYKEIKNKLREIEKSLKEIKDKG